jgi:hypothetical protein
MRHLASIIIAFLLSTAARAQIATTTSLIGTVTDQSGRTVPATRISVVNRDSGDRYSSVTNDLGYYNIQFIHVGTYDVIVERDGFQRVEKTGIVVKNNETVRNDVTLAIGPISQSVIVKASPHVIQTEGAAVSEYIDARDLTELPLNGRDPLRLATTTPAVIQGLKTTTGYPPGEDFIGAGTREIQNSISLDGISIVNNLINNTSVQPMPEAIQEMEVQTGTYSAQYGGYMGVHLNLVTKSGTNALHGVAVEFIRNDYFDARPYFLQPTARKSPLRQNQFGFELDGPVVIPHLYNGRNRTFFMGEYSGLRQSQGVASLATLMTPQMFQGNFSQVSTPIKDPITRQPFAGNIIPAARVSPVVPELQQYYPQPNLPGITNNFSAVVPNENNFDQTIIRIDQNLGEHVRLFVRYEGQWQNLLTGSPNPANATISPVANGNFSVGYTHVLTPRLVSEARFGGQYSNASLVNQFYVDHIVSAGANLGIPGFDADVLYNNPGIPDFMVPGFTAFLKYWHELICQ